MPKQRKCSTPNTSLLRNFEETDTSSTLYLKGISRLRNFRSSGLFTGANKENSFQSKNLVQGEINGGVSPAV